jgi:hypothetical protein
MPVVGSYTYHRTSINRETNLVLQLDYSQRVEIVAGATISSASAVCMKQDTTSTDFTVGTVSISGAKVNAVLSDVASIVGAYYYLVYITTLSTGAVLVHSLLILVEDSALP